MSVQAVHWAMYDAPMLRTDAGKPDSTARQVLSVFAEHADEYGANSFPGPLRIAYATGLDERTVERATRRLERAGLIVRDGIARTGTVRWRLVLSARRPESDFDDLQAAADKARRLDSDRRQARRVRATVDVSGTQNAGQPDPNIDDGDGVRHAECRMSGTQSADVRHAAPPEPSTNHPMNHPSGGTLPPDPLRSLDPTSSDLGNEKTIPIYEHDPLHGDVEGNHRPRAREQHPRCPHGFTPGRRPDGSSTCVFCRQAAARQLLAPVIPIHRRRTA